MKRFILFLLTFSLFAFNSCRKSDRDDDIETQSSTDNLLCDALWNDVYKQLDDAAAVTPDVNRVIPSVNPAVCYTVTVTPAFPSTIYPKTMTVDFGPTNCSGPDGVNRRGKLVVVFTGKYRDSLTQITISPSNFFVNDYQITGNKTVKNLGHLSGIMTFDIQIPSASIIRPDGKSISWSSYRTRKWVAGESTLAVVSDDAYTVSGNMSGTSVTGAPFNVSTIADLRIEMNCRWIVSGQLKLQPGNLNPRFIDFGDGTCNDQAVVSINGNTYTITLN